jgi:hypothetical protein
MKNLIVVFSLILISYQVIYTQDDTFSSNPPGKWNFPMNITYDYDSSVPNAFEYSIDMAAESWSTWNNSQLGIKFVPEFNSAYYFSYCDCGSNRDGIILAQTTEVVQSGVIYNCFTEITTDPTVCWNTGPDCAIIPFTDLQSTMLHELGHWLNLDDNRSNSAAIMYYNLIPGNNKRVLTSFDTGPVYSLYHSTGICNTCLPFPTNLKAAIVGQNVVLSWVNPTYTDNCYQLQVIKNGSSVANLPLTSTSYTDVNEVNTLPANYYISVLGSGTGISSSISISVSPTEPVNTNETKILCS